MSGEDASPPQSAEDLLDCVQLVPEHLRANGTIHTKPFGGITELIDNAVDSKATNVTIQRAYYTRTMGDGSTKRLPYYIVADNGCGMDREEALKTILVGYSLKRGDVGKIGQFGNGLKSGSMRVGDTMLLGTKKDNVFTVLMISLPYLDTVQGNKCLVPCISYKFDKVSGEMTANRSVNEKEEKHGAALSIIMQWSPFGKEEDLFEFLKGSIGESGTVIAMSDLRRMENNEFELQWKDDDLAVKKRDADGGAAGFEYLSEWLQDLYIDPKVSIFINQKQVRLVDPLRSLASPRWTLLSSSGMTPFVNREKQRVEEELKKMENQMIPIQQRLSTIASQLSITPTNRELQKEQRVKSNLLEEYKKQCEQISQRLPNIGKNKPGSTIRVYFGIDLERRADPRAIFYSSGRRILVQPFKANGDKAFKLVMGVVCIVDIPSTLLPTKQHRESFEVQAEFDVIFKKMERHAKSYFEHIDKQYKDSIFWKSLGYDQHVFYQFDIPDLSKKEVEKKIFELMGRGRRQCGRCREFRSITWEVYNEEKRDSKFLCALDEDGQSCVALTQAEKRAEEIKKLDFDVESTFFMEVEAVKEKMEVREVKKPLKPTQREKSPPLPVLSDDSPSTDSTGNKDMNLSAVRSRIAGNPHKGRSPSPSSEKSSSISNSSSLKRIPKKSSAASNTRTADSTAKKRPANKRKKPYSSSSDEDGSSYFLASSPSSKRGSSSKYRRTSRTSNKANRTPQKGGGSDEEDEDENENEDYYAPSTRSRNRIVPKRGGTSQKKDKRMQPDSEDDVVELFPLFRNEVKKEVKREEFPSETMEFGGDQRSAPSGSNYLSRLESKSRASLGVASGLENKRKMDIPKTEPMDASMENNGIDQNGEAGTSNANARRNYGGPRQSMTRSEQVRANLEEMTKEQLIDHAIRLQNTSDEMESEYNQMLHQFVSLEEATTIFRVMEELRDSENPSKKLAEILGRGSQNGGPPSVDHEEEI